MPERFHLNPALDVASLRESYRRKGRVLVEEFVEGEDAWVLHDYLRKTQAWKLVLNQGEKLFELDRAAQQGMTLEERRELDAAVHRASRYGFQFCFENIRVPDAEEQRRGDSNPVNDFAVFLCSEPVMSLLRSVTGAIGIDFADAQATAYGPGHFLTMHDDLVAGKNRQAAYVFGLTPKWSIDWGGLLLFRDAGQWAEAVVPGFNVMSVFSVPQPHCVSMVAPFAANRRYSVTGWLRSVATPQGSGAASQQTHG